MRLILIEDDNMLGEGLSKGLKNIGYTVDWAKNAKDGLYAIEQYKYDLLLLDLKLPDMDGLELLRQIRKKEDKILTIIITAKDSIEEKVGGLDAGGDDYLVKPFSLDELAARIRALSRRKLNAANNEIEFCGLKLDLKKFEATIDNKTIKLSAKEFALLNILISNPNQPFSKSALEERLYGWEDNASSNTIEVFIHSLRKKLGDKWIKNIRGVGYFIPKNPI